MDTLFVIKIVATGLSGALGLLSAVSDFKERDTNRFTQPGRVAIALIILSVLVAIGADILSHRKDIAGKRQADLQHSEEVQQKFEENNRIIAEINRAGVPLGNLEATLAFDLDYEQFPSYAKRFTAAVKTWKPTDPRRLGFANTDLMAPGVPQPITKLFGIPGFGPVASDEVKLANSVKPKPNTATIRISRGTRQLEGRLHFGPSYKFIPQLERKRLVINYTVPHVEWSNPTREDVSLFNLDGATVKVTPDFHPAASVKELSLRAPASNHRLIASDLVASEASGTVTGTLKTP